MPFQHILVAMAGGGREHAKARLGAEMARVHGATLTFVHVNHPLQSPGSVVGGSHDLSFTEDEFADYVRQQLDDLDPGGDVQFALIDGWKEESLQQASRHCDLLVLGHEHQNAAVEFFTDTFDERVVNRVTVPVLVVPQDLG